MLAEEYRRQFQWRDWQTAMGLLPAGGGTVLDLGCGVGDQARALGELGFEVIGVDGNAELLAEATCRVHRADLGDLSGLPLVDGIWSSFTAAYFADFPRVLSHWLGFLRPGGWIALTEMDDLLGHEPLSSRARVEQFYDQAAYDFRAGRKLAEYCRGAGLRVACERKLADQELSFAGPASPEVLEAWRARFARMPGMLKFMGPGFEQEFLAAMSAPQHVSRCQVHFVLAYKD